MKRAWFAIFALTMLWSGTQAEAASDPQFGTRPLATPTAPHSPVQTAAAGDAEPAQETGTTDNHQPTFPGRSSFVRNDPLDEWCKGSTTALLTAICGDDELRALALERLHAFDDAKSRLTPDQQKKLIADQNQWALSYPTACGLNADVQPSLPLEASLKDCLAKAGQARLQYLKDYGQTKPETAATPATTAPPAASAQASPAPAPSARTANGPAVTPSPAATAPAPAAPTPSQNKEAHQEATATIPPAAMPAKPALSDSGPAAAPQRNSSLSKIGDYTRTGAMLIAILVVIIWAITAWLQGRSRRAGKTAETRR